MSIIKISREFSNSQLGNLWIGNESTIDDGLTREERIQKYIEAWDEAGEAFRRIEEIRVYGTNGVYVIPPYIASTMGTPPNPNFIPTIQVSKTDSKDKAIQSIKEEIESCKDLGTLETYKKVAHTETELLNAYQTTLLKLR